MTVADVPTAQRWEQMLLSRAAVGHDAQNVSAGRFVADQGVLARAYAQCDALTRACSRSFYLASSLLPSPKRQAIRALYAFCRVCDDIVDGPEHAGAQHAALVDPERALPRGLSHAVPLHPQHVTQRCLQPEATECGQADAASVLEAWRRVTTAPLPFVVAALRFSRETTAMSPLASSLPAPTWDRVALAWTDTRCRYHIPSCYAEQLIDGVAQDLHPTRYATFSDLAAYAYGVASTVGLMSMHIIGYAGDEAIPYAIKLGVALQLTNILRDVGADLRAGRVYLPQDELVVFGLTEADLARGQIDERWRAFMRFQIGRTRRLYAEAWPGIALLHKDGRLAIAAAGAFYRAILDDIEAHDYDVFRRRAHVGSLGKLRRLPGLWLNTRRMRGGCDERPYL